MQIDLQHLIRLNKKKKSIIDLGGIKLDLVKQKKQFKVICHTPTHEMTYFDSDKQTMSPNMKTDSHANNSLHRTHRTRQQQALNTILTI